MLEQDGEVFAKRGTQGTVLSKDAISSTRLQTFLSGSGCLKGSKWYCT